MGLPSITLLTADSPSVMPMFGAPQWGIFQNGQPLLVADSVGSVEYSREYQISNYPQEATSSNPGTFESYNKVQVPYEARVTLLSSLTREQLLNTIEPLIASLSLVQVAMPELQYQNANLTRYAFRRTSRAGVTLIAIDVWCKEVRFATSSASQQNTGGTARPVGQSYGNTAAGTTPNTGVGNSDTESLPPNATTTGNFNSLTSGTGPTQIPLGGTSSTNAAYPTQSGPVTPAGIDLGPASTAVPLG